MTRLLDYTAQIIKPSTLSYDDRMRSMAIDNIKKSGVSDKNVYDMISKEKCDHDTTHNMTKNLIRFCENMYNKPITGSDEEYKKEKEIIFKTNKVRSWSEFNPYYINKYGKHPTPLLYRDKDENSFKRKKS